jgi:hypothetical protein
VNNVIWKELGKLRITPPSVDSGAVRRFCNREIAMQILELDDGFLIAMSMVILLSNPTRQAPEDE